jgi:hypothetical protein
MPAPPAASDWRADGNTICTDYYDDLAIFGGRPERVLARLPDRPRAADGAQDARLTHVHPPAAHAATFKRMVRLDLRSAKTLRQIAKRTAGPASSGWSPLRPRHRGRPGSPARCI